MVMILRHTIVILVTHTHTVSSTVSHLEITGLVVVHVEGPEQL